MAILDVIEWHDDFGHEMVHREPQDGSGEFRLGSQLVVRDGQIAVFYKDGKGLDTFGPGRHTLETGNIPLLTTLLALPFGGKSPFRAEVLYVATKTFNEMKWGTKEPVAFRDTELGIVRVRAFGNYTMRVTDARTLINEVVGSRGMFTTDAIGGYLRDVIVSRFNDVLGETMKSILDLPAHYDEIGQKLRARVAENFSKFGIEVQDFFIQAITPPEEVQKAMDDRAAAGAVGDMNRYMKYKTAAAMGDAAKNPGMAGAAVGMMVPGMMGQAMNLPDGTPAAGGITCPSCHTANAAGAKFCSGCGKGLAAGAACPKCNAVNAPGAKFCNSCGTSLAVAAASTCAKCNTANAPGAKFCANCGQTLG
ncbi:MAG TPA: SPFH domain-containing protein [bacterium]|nr:SPFH domain-containing protein [bacterium]